MKLLSFFLCLMLLLNAQLMGRAGAQLIKSGILTTSEVWSEEVKIVGDVVVPEGMELEIKPGTILLYEEGDQKNYGKREDIPELVIYGTLKVGKSDEGASGFDLVPLDSRTKIIKISPYQVDTKILRDEFRAFRIQYAIIWVALTSALIYTVANR